jgi:hypothetical protein
VLARTLDDVAFAGTFVALPASVVGWPGSIGTTGAVGELVPIVALLAGAGVVFVHAGRTAVTVPSKTQKKPLTGLLPAGNAMLAIVT